MNRFGQKVRELRQGKGLSLRGLAPLVGVGYAYLSKVETGRLDFGDYPSEALIHKLADVLKGDEEELLLLAQKVPERIKQRVLQRPDVFARLAAVDDASLDGVIRRLDRAAKTPRKRKPG